MVSGLFIRSYFVRRTPWCAAGYRMFSGAPPRHDAPPAPDPRVVAVEAHMLPDAAASLYTGRDRLRSYWGACQRFSGSDCGIDTVVAHECVAPISLESTAKSAL